MYPHPRELTVRDIRMAHPTTRSVLHRKAYKMACFYRVNKSSFIVKRLSIHTRCNINFKVCLSSGAVRTTKIRRTRSKSTDISNPSFLNLIIRLSIAVNIFRSSLVATLFVGNKKLPSSNNVSRRLGTLEHAQGLLLL
jgi:hypothetical protein